VNCLWVSGWRRVSVDYGFELKETATHSWELSKVFLHFGDDNVYAYGSQGALDARTAHDYSKCNYCVTQLKHSMPIL
jgi:hypothetical protein